MAHQEKLNLMKDLLEHMGDCCDEWQHAEDQREWVFADSLRRNLSEFHRLCDSLLAERHETPTAAVAW